MTLINRKHPQIIAESGKGRKEIYVHVDKNYMHFTSKAVQTYGLQAGKYLHFIQEGIEWYFIQNDDPDGFLLVEREHGRLRVASTGLMKVFFRTTGVQPGIKLFVGPSDRRKDRDIMYEIFTKKTYDQIVKAS